MEALGSSSHLNTTITNSSAAEIARHFTNGREVELRSGSSGNGPSYFPPYSFLPSSLQEYEVEIRGLLDSNLNLYFIVRLFNLLGIKSPTWLNEILEGNTTVDEESVPESPCKKLKIESVAFQLQNLPLDILAQILEDEVSPGEIIFTLSQVNKSLRDSIYLILSSQDDKIGCRFKEVRKKALNLILKDLSQEAIVHLMRISPFLRTFVPEVLNTQAGNEESAEKISEAAMLSFSSEELMELVYNNSFFRNFIQKSLDSRDGDKVIAKKVAEAMLSDSSAEGLYFLQEQYGRLTIQFLLFTPNLALESYLDIEDNLHLERYGIKVLIPYQHIEHRFKHVISKWRYVDALPRKLRHYFSTHFFKIRDTLQNLEFSALTPEQQAFFDDSKNSIWNNVNPFENFIHLQSFLSFNFIKTLPSAAFKKVFFTAIYVAHKKAIETLIHHPEFSIWLQKENYNLVIDSIKAALLEGHFDIVECILKRLIEEKKHKAIMLLWQKEYGPFDECLYFLRNIKKGNLDIIMETLKEQPVNNPSHLQFLLNISLYLAAKKGHAEVVKYLIKNGADIHYKGNLGCEPWQAAGLFSGVIQTLMNKKV